jgi:hypothetical protein
MLALSSAGDHAVYKAIASGLDDRQNRRSIAMPAADALAIARLTEQTER